MHGLKLMWWLTSRAAKSHRPGHAFVIEQCIEGNVVRFGFQVRQPALAVDLSKTSKVSNDIHELRLMPRILSVAQVQSDFLSFPAM